MNHAAPIEEALWIVIVGLCLFGIVDEACGQSDDKTVLALATCFAAECDGCGRHKDERPAMAWVMKKGLDQYNANTYNKRTYTYAQWVRMYCAVWDRDSEYYTDRRARTIRASTVRESKHLTADKWQETLKWCRWFLEQNWKVPDPHPRSKAFGGRMDIKQAKKKGLRILKKYCNKQGKWCTIIFG